MLWSQMQSLKVTAGPTVLGESTVAVQLQFKLLPCLDEPLKSILQHDGALYVTKQ